MTGHLPHRSRPVSGRTRMRRFHQALLTTLCVAAMLLLSSKVAATMPGAVQIAPADAVATATD